MLISTFLINFGLKYFDNVRVCPSLWPRGLRFACWDCGFESRRGYGCPFLLNVVCCQVDVSASGWSLVQSSSTECGVSECDREASRVRRPWPTRGWCAVGKKSACLFVSIAWYDSFAGHTYNYHILALNNLANTTDWQYYLTLSTFH